MRIVGQAEIEDVDGDGQVVEDAQDTDVGLHDFAAAGLAEVLLTQDHTGEGVDVEAIGDEPCRGRPVQDESGPIGQGGGADDVVGPLPLAEDSGKEDLAHREADQGAKGVG